MACRIHLSSIFLVVVTCASVGAVTLYACTFDENANPACSFDLEISNSDRPWVLKSGPSPQARTGPPSDRSGRGRYLLAQTSERTSRGLVAIGRGQRFRMSSPSLSTGNKRLVMRFYYFMWGRNVNTLNIFLVVRGEKKSPKPIWRRSGSQEAVWTQGEIRLPPNATGKAIFEAVSGNGLMGDIAIDDITVEEYSVDCTFEDDIPTRDCNFTQSTSDDFDWRTNSGKTLTRRTGPMRDHTLGKTKGVYMYAEANDRTVGDRAAYMSAVYVKDSQGPCVASFYYHMHGNQIGSLSVYVMTSPDQANFGSLVWHRDGEQGKVWLEGRANITDVGGRFQIVFVVEIGGGSVGDIAIDDFKLLGSGCLNLEYYGGEPSRAGNTTSPMTTANYTTVSPPVTVTVNGSITPPMSACTSQPCMNGGTCVSTPDGFRCNCTQNWSGESCQINVTSTPCAVNPCLNGGYCVLPNVTNSSMPTNQNFTCVCPDEWTGEICNQVNDTFDFCTPNPCANGGTCRRYAGSYLCDCPQEWTGVTCDEDFNECNQENGTGPCENGGVCNNVVSGYSCSCPTNFYGDHCELECIDEHDSCAYWMGIGECDINPRYMRHFCRYSCGVCIDYACQDNHERCPYWASIGECDRNPRWMLANCHLSCKVCLDDECRSSPCLNGGSCIDGNSSYTCQCPPGYTGINCETDVDECSSAPCQHDGTCIDLINGFSCNCTERYEGAMCQDVVDFCCSQPCLNDGTCSLSESGYNCSCSYGFEGENCEIDIDECLTADCMNGGTCIDQPGGYVCNCTSAYTGVRCEHDFNECVSDPCLNGGSCFHGIGQALYFCHCVDGWEGNDCQQEINECASNPCQNGGTCADQLNAFNCTCADGWTGDSCETEINECASNPCQHGGVCVDELNGYTCLCRNGWEGLVCADEINECLSFPCENGGSCVDLPNGHICNCGADWTGRYCEIKITTPAPTTTTIPPVPTTTEDWLPSEFIESSYDGWSHSEKSEGSEGSEYFETSPSQPTTSTATPTTTQSSTSSGKPITTVSLTTASTETRITTRATTTQRATTTRQTTTSTTPMTTTTPSTTQTPTTTRQRTTTIQTTTIIPSTASATTRLAQRVTTDANKIEVSGTATPRNDANHNTNHAGHASTKTQKAENKIVIIATVLGGLLLVVIVCVLLAIVVRMRRKAGLGQYHQFTMEEADKPSSESNGWHELKFRSFGDRYNRLDDNGAI
ncbi:uncharacterized protein [Diadema antillarum]|uniref:uncharacterized protein n=1 Tax=Diadema antillarum TaxID=105358 RepID=UPI003A8B200B